MTRRPGPYSRRDLSTFSGRTREGAFLRGVRAELVQHVGGKPSPTQAALIEAAAQLRLRIALMDRPFAEDGRQSEHDSRTYLSWVSTLGRLMQRLDGLKGSAAPAPPSLADILAAAAPPPPATRRRAGTARTPPSAVQATAGSETPADTDGPLAGTEAAP